MSEELTREEKDRFNELVELLDDLKTSGKINSGFDISVNPENGLIRLKTRENVRETAGALKQMINRALVELTSVAYIVAFLVDTKDPAWCKSSMNTVMVFLETETRAQLKALDGEEGAGEPCNDVSVAYLVESIFGLSKYVWNSPMIRLASRELFLLLEAFATTYIEQNQLYTMYKKMSFNAEELLAFARAPTIMGTNDLFVMYVRNVLALDILNTYKALYADVASGSASTALIERNAGICQPAKK